MKDSIEQKCIKKGVKLTDQRKIIAKVMTESDYESEKLQNHPGYIRWWKDESLKLDIEKE